MGIVMWTPEMSVGVERLDTQHAMLLDIINQLHEGMLQGRGGDVIGPAVEELLRYAREHFAEEEGLLRRHNYPRLAEHLTTHQTFCTKVAEVSAQVKTGRPMLAIPTMDFVRDWFSKHILVVDMQYKDYVAACETT